MLQGTWLQQAGALWADQAFGTGPWEAALLGAGQQPASSEARGRRKTLRRGRRPDAAPPREAALHRCLGFTMGLSFPTITCISTMEVCD